ncbi:MAG: AAA family ATPase, partial [Sphingobacteriales bacterium]
VSEGIEVIIIDSVSHEWEGSGGILDIHSNMQGNSFTNWSKLTPRHNAFVQAILQSPCHIIGTVRTKQEYVLSEKNGKQVPEKIGLKGVTKEGLDYEFTLVFELDIKNNATATKDRTSLFIGKPEFKVTSEIGGIILNWCNQTSLQDGEIDVKQRINGCRSIAELLQFYQTNPQYKETYQDDFTKRKRQLTRSSNSKASQNGVASKTE